MATEIDYYAGVVAELHGRAFQVGDEFLNYTILKPVGVAGLIMPWNAPLMLSTWRIAPISCSSPQPRRTSLPSWRTASRAIPSARSRFRDEQLAERDLDVLVVDELLDASPAGRSIRMQ